MGKAPTCCAAATAGNIPLHKTAADSPRQTSRPNLENWKCFMVFIIDHRRNKENPTPLRKGKLGFIVLSERGHIQHCYGDPSDIFKYIR